MIKRSTLSEEQYGPIAEEAKSTLKEHERRHFWEQLEKIEQDLSNSIRSMKGIVQNPMQLKGEDLNNFIEESANFIQETKVMYTFLIRMVRYIDKKIPHTCTCRRDKGV